MSKVRIFLVDDHAVLREGLALLINAQPDLQVVGQAGNGEETLQQVPHCRPDMVIMDIAMPGMGGIEATSAIKTSLPAVHILALTRHREPGYLRRLFQAGARGYVLKKTAADELITAIRSIAAGGIYIDPALAANVAEQLGAGVPPAPSSSVGQKALSERETEVLRLIAWGQSNKEIAAALGLSVKTVEYYKASAVEKLQLPSRTAIVRYALAQGWLQDDDDPM